MFHVWGAFAAVATAVSRKVWLPFEDTAIYPNIYVMYVGKAGNGKSWAMQKCKRILGEAGITAVSGSVETAPGLWRHMAGDPNAKPPTKSPVSFVTKWPDGVLRDCHPMTIIANEFVNFISMDAPGWISALNDIYDEDVYRYRTKHQGDDQLVGPYICLLGALTNEVASDLQKSRIIATGLARRTLFQFGERAWDKPVAKPEFTEEQRVARAACVDYLRVLKSPTVAGSFDWPDDVDRWWRDWYGPHLALVPTRAPTVEAWYASKSTQMLKLAMLGSLMEGTSLHLEVKHFELAKRLLETLEEDLPRIFGGVGRNELAGVAMKIYEAVLNYGKPFPMKRLRNAFFTMCKPPSDFDACIQYLLDTEQLVRKTMQIGAQLDDIIGTPDQVARFVAEVAGQKLAAQNGSHPGTPPAIDPSSAPKPTPPDSPADSAQAGPRPAGETPTG